MRELPAFTGKQATLTGGGQVFEDAAAARAATPGEGEEGRIGFYMALHLLGREYLPSRPRVPLETLEAAIISSADARRDAYRSFGPVGTYDRRRGRCRRSAPGGRQGWHCIKLQTACDNASSRSQRAAAGTYAC